MRRDEHFTSNTHTFMETLLTLPDSPVAPLSIRAKALVFHDPASLGLLEHIERIARSEATVLVTGETGTGKELIARHIHAVSGRKGPFIAVNCGAFSESLIDAELFGHESGAFTGASQSRAGWFEAANGGTLFLDEIGDLPMALQVKLLRVLQERQVVRLGSRKAVSLDVRLVAATNIDLARAVAAQHFRADLYYRLSVASVRLPPLRERPADIVPLARHFLAVYQGRLHINEVTLSAASQSALLAYGWPGNIRELENVIHFALIVCRSGEIQPEDIRLVPLTATSSAPAATPSVLGTVAGGLGVQGDPVADAATVRPPDAGLGPVAVGSIAGGVTPAPHPGHRVEPDGSPWGQLEAALMALMAQGEEALYDRVEAAVVTLGFAHAGQNQVRAAKVLGITRNMVRTQLKRHGLLLDA
jgi:sigma-54-specific transcriptional regulator